MRLNDLKASEEALAKEPVENYEEEPKLDSRELLAALFNRNYFDTEEQVEDYNPGYQFVN
jgi:hypothetical protein